MRDHWDSLVESSRNPAKVRREATLTKNRRSCRAESDLAGVGVGRQRGGGWPAPPAACPLGPGARVPARPAFCFCSVVRGRMRRGRGGTGPGAGWSAAQRTPASAATKTLAACSSRRAEGTGGNNVRGMPVFWCGAFSFFLSLPFNSLSGHVVTEQGQMAV